MRLIDPIDSKKKTKTLNKMKIESNWVKAELNNLSNNADLAASTLDDASLLMTTRRTAQKEYEKLKEQLAEIKKVEYRKRMALKIAKEKE